MMGIKAALEEFRRVKNQPTRHEVYLLGELVGTCTEEAMTEDEEEVLFYDFYPRSPKGIFPIGNIAVNFYEGEVYLFEENKEQEVLIHYENGVDLVQAIIKEL